MKIGVLVFPGSNCDYDCYHLAAQVLGAEASFIWHEESHINADLVIVPGGFSYGDYLRCGAIARFAPVMEALRNFADQGKPVIGICNGFQILVESGLLSGTLLRNTGLRFLCKDVYLRVDSNATPFTSHLALGSILRMPIAHNEGNYFVSRDEYSRLNSNHQIVLRYCDASGASRAESNPNGSYEHIAGVCNARGNVLGMMPHPERASEVLLGNQDGLRLFTGLLKQTVLA